MKVKWWVTREGYLDNENYGGTLEIPDEKFENAYDCYHKEGIIDEQVNDAFNQYISYAWEIVEE
jgi:hypothetical protein